MGQETSKNDDWPKESTVRVCRALGVVAAFGPQRGGLRSGCTRLSRTSADTAGGSVSDPPPKDGRVNVEEKGGPFEAGDVDDSGLSLCQREVSSGCPGGCPVRGAFCGLHQLECGGLGPLGGDEALTDG